MSRFNFLISFRWRERVSYSNMAIIGPSWCVKDLGLRIISLYIKGDNKSSQDQQLYFLFIFLFNNFVFRKFFQNVNLFYNCLNNSLLAGNAVFLL